MAPANGLPAAAVMRTAVSDEGRRRARPARTAALAQALSGSASEPGHRRRYGDGHRCGRRLTGLDFNGADIAEPVWHLGSWETALIRGDDRGAVGLAGSIWDGLD